MPSLGSSTPEAVGNPRKEAIMGWYWEATVGKALNGWRWKLHHLW